MSRERLGNLFSILMIKSGVQCEKESSNSNHRKLSIEGLGWALDKV